MPAAALTNGAAAIFLIILYVMVVIMTFGVLAWLVRNESD